MLFVFGAGLEPLRDCSQGVLSRLRYAEELANTGAIP